MNQAVIQRTKQPKSRLSVVDCDIHPSASSPSEVQQFMTQEMREHWQTFGARVAQPFLGTIPYPRMSPGNGSRMDAYPPKGGPAASDLGFLQEQLLDLYDIEFGMLQPLSVGSVTFDQKLGAAICSAVNDWQLSKWCHPEPRLKAAICVPQEDPDAAVAEIEKRAKDGHFAQVAIPPRTAEPIGRKRYWRVLECAAYHGFPIGLHSGAYGWHANTGSGWASYYWEEHMAFAYQLQGVVQSLVFEGAFERIPDLKAVAIEGGFAWAAPLGWRMDKQFDIMRKEVPHLKKKPSEYMRTQMWYTTQPIEEPERKDDIHDIIRWIGEDRLMFSTDYPHWDFDDPRYAFQVNLPEDIKKKIMGENAKQLYRLG